MSGSAQCPRSDLHFDIHHAGFSDCSIHYLEIKARCKICDKRMVFQGLPLGMTPHHPTGALDGGEARLPFLGEGEELTGKVIGFTGRVVDFPAGVDGGP